MPSFFSSQSLSLKSNMQEFISPDRLRHNFHDLRHVEMHRIHIYKTIVMTYFPDYHFHIYTDNTDEPNFNFF